MPDVHRTEHFSDWLAKLKDQQAKALILTRIIRLSIGNAGDVRPVGGGISELRIDYGPDYRVYDKRIGPEVVLLIAGGDKATRDKDIRRLKTIARDLDR